MIPTLDGDLIRAFVAVADSKSFTQAGRQLFRTQSAVSMQIKRLEEQLGKTLFLRSGRRVRLTADGEILLGYARRLLSLNDEAVTRFTQPEMSGVVRIGAPDDYATYFLPGVLAPFASAYPQVRVEVVCENSLDLMPKLADGSFDLALVSRSDAVTGGELVRREPLVWVGSATHNAHEKTPLPLALFPQHCICREYALAALDSVGRAWRLAYISRSISLLQAAVREGLAVSAMELSTLSTGMRVLEPGAGFPTLPEIEVALHRAPGTLSEPAARLAEFIVERLAVCDSA